MLLRFLQVLGETSHLENFETLHQSSSVRTARRKLVGLQQNMTHLIGGGGQRPASLTPCLGQHQTRRFSGCHLTFPTAIGLVSKRLVSCMTPSESPLGLIHGLGHHVGPSSLLTARVATAVTSTHLVIVFLVVVVWPPSAHIQQRVPDRNRRRSIVRLESIHVVVEQKLSKGTRTG